MEAWLASGAGKAEGADIWHDGLVLMLRSILPRGYFAYPNLSSRYFAGPSNRKSRFAETLGGLLLSPLSCFEGVR
jgi:hypothetical protein